MLSVTVVHAAKAVGQNEMPFGRDTLVVPSNIVLDRGPSLRMERGHWGGVGPQFSAMPPVTKLLWLLF